MTQDVIDILVGKTLAVRARRPITKTQSQLSHEALFERQTTYFTRLERFAIALFVAILHQDSQAQNFYGGKLQILDQDLAKIIAQLGTTALTSGPYGHYPDGPLSRENVDGIDWCTDTGWADKLGQKLSCALEHAHFLVFHPRDASKARLEKLKNTGWDTDAIVTLSQLVAFLSYQLRVAHGLRVLGSVS